MRSLFNISKMSIRCGLQQGGVAQTLRAEKQTNIQQNVFNNQSDNLKKLKQYMEYHKFSKAIKEIDRLTQENVDIPIQHILEQLVKYSEFELTNKLYDILQKQEIKLSDISYNYLIDANLKFKNIHYAQNIAIHVSRYKKIMIFQANLSGVILDTEVYRVLFSSLPIEMDNSFRRVLYKLYKEHFKLSTKILYDLAILGNATQDYELLNELEEDSIKQGMKIPDNLKKISSREKQKQKNQDTAQVEQQAKENEQPQAKEKLEDISDILYTKEKSIGLSPILNFDDNLSEQFSNKNNSFVFNQNLDSVGNDILNFIKKGQKKGVFSSKQAPLVFVIKSSEEQGEFDNDEESDEEYYNGEYKYEGEGLNSYSDEESD